MINSEVPRNTVLGLFIPFQAQRRRVFPKPTIQFLVIARLTGTDKFSKVCIDC